MLLGFALSLHLSSTYSGFDLHSPLAMTILPISDFLSSDAPLLDVRAPSEYKEGHIPDAISFPLFSDEERAIVGTLYKQNGQKAAIK